MAKNSQEHFNSSLIGTAPWQSVRSIHRSMICQPPNELELSRSRSRDSGESNQPSLVQISNRREHKCR